MPKIVPNVQLPSVGRIVHYVSYGTPNGEYQSQCRAAIVTEVSKDVQGKWEISLAVFNPEGMFFNQKVDWTNANDHIGGTWHWPEFVDDWITL